MPLEQRWPSLVPDLIARHRVLDLDLVPWFKRPAKVRIALYAEGTIAFNGGSFQGLQRVVAALKSDPWPWVKFEPVLIHRNSDPSADQQNKPLDQINLDSFDELWLFGFASGDLLTPGERAAVNTFMDKGGGVLHTGDHASLGQGIAGSLKRAGLMRQYPAPEAAPGVWNNTLRSGANAIYEFIDQSDDVPQDIRLKWYSDWRFTVGNALRRRYPHPVLCGSDGPIYIFPDHQHEGVAVAPVPSPPDWPSKNGYTPRAEVIAWGRIEAPDADIGREFGLVSVYDGHGVDVGRIVADSTWHHWFDINLDGFTATPLGLTRLKTIERYFLNVAAWLAPKAKQKHMRDGVFAIAVRRDPLVMLNPRILDPWVLGSLARDALGQFAPQCLIIQWVLDVIPPLVREQLKKIIDPDPPPLGERRPLIPLVLPIEDLVIASVIEPLLEQQSEIQDVVTEMKPAVVDRAFSGALDRTAALISEQAQVLQQLGQVADLLRQK